MAYPGLDFYSRNTELVARDLLGKKLVRIYEDGPGKPKRLSGIIYETEAYGSKNDPASHAFNGVTSRNSIMFRGFGKADLYSCFSTLVTSSSISRIFINSFFNISTIVSQFLFFGILIILNWLF